MEFTKPSTLLRTCKRAPKREKGFYFIQNGAQDVHYDKKMNSLHALHLKVF